MGNDAIGIGRVGRGRWSSLDREAVEGSERGEGKISSHMPANPRRMGGRKDAPRADGMTAWWSRGR